MNAMTDAHGVDQTVFIQILNAYNLRNPCALISDSEYNECLEQLVSSQLQQHDGHAQQRITEVHKNGGLQERLGTKLFIKPKNGENIVVAGTKTRYQELIPFSKVYNALVELNVQHNNPGDLQLVVREKVLGIPEEIVQEYCDMASSATLLDEQPEEKEAVNQLKRCHNCNIEKTVNEFLPDDKDSTKLRSKCIDCDSRSRHKRKVKIYPGEELIQEVNIRTKDSSHNGTTGTSICAACGVRKPNKDYDKDGSKPTALKCRECAKLNVALRSKSCCSCYRELTLDHFYRDSSTKAGFRPRCMECMRAKKDSSRSVERRQNKAQASAQNIAVKNELLKKEGLEAVGEAPSVGRGGADGGGADVGVGVGGVGGNADLKIPTKRRSRRKSRAVDLSPKVIESHTKSPKEEDLALSFSKRSRSRHNLRSRAVDLEPSRVKISALNALSVKTSHEKRKIENEGLEAKAPIIEIEENREKGKGTAVLTVKDSQDTLTKFCTGCHQDKLVNEFGRDCSKVSGLRSRCRVCQRRKNRPPSPSVVGTLEVIHQGPNHRRKIPRKPNRQRRASQKVCLKCDLEKPTSDFYRDKAQLDGFSPFCKRCSNAAKKRQEKAQPSDKPSVPHPRPQPVYGPQVEEDDMEHILDYVDALLPESSGESAGRSEYMEEEEEIISNSTPDCRSHRICVGCHLDKSWVEFNLNPMLPAGLCPLCKDCLRGNGAAGRRAIKQTQQRRRCVRCKHLRSSIHFAKSILFPNRITRICYKCRNQELSTVQSGSQGTSSMNNSESIRKRKRSDSGLREALDFIDYECDALRVRDPGGGEELWKNLDSESDSALGQWTKHKKDNPSIIQKDRSFLNTQLRIEKNGVTLTHHIPAENWMTVDALSNTENSFLKIEDKYRRKPKILEKQCKTCGEIKKEDCFTVDTSMICRLSSQCNDCKNREL